MKNLRTHFLISLVLVAIATFGMYYLITLMFPLTVPASSQAAQIDTLIDYHYWVIAFLFSLVIVILLYAVVVFRRKEGEEGDGVHMHGHTALEVAWTVAPLGLVVLFAVIGTNMLGDIIAEQPNEFVVKVEGFQWGWSYRYEEVPGAPELSGVELTDLYLPLDRPVRLEMESRDVLHSFWVPEFRVKQDLMPGRPTILRFTPTKTHEQIASEHGNPNYKVQVRCAEICGTSHAYMLSDVFVIGGSDQVFADIMRSAAALPSDPAERGAVWYEQFGCNSCHSIDGELDNYTGPSWLGLYESERVFDDGTTAIADDEYIISSIINPNGQIVEGYPAGQMPQDFEDQFATKQAELLASAGAIESDVAQEILEYIKTLTNE